jgi:hypothetical protein
MLFTYFKPWLIIVEVFWVVMPCRVGVGTGVSEVPENGGNMDL